MSGRVCPWVSWDEWNSVRGSLLGPDARAAAAALDRIEAWRRRGRLPLGVDITSSLVSTFLRDPVAPRPHLRPQLATQASTSSQGSLQSEYALTLIRFVNGVSDSFQKGKVATSVSKHAEYAGLHPMLVDVRHEATHNHLPSLHTLRLAAAHAFSWLESNYWQAQEQKLVECSAEASRLIAQLIENQASRLKFASRPCDESSSDSDLEDMRDIHVGVLACGQAPSAAALRKQQRSLLSELRQMIPASQPAAIAAALINCDIFAPHEVSAGAIAHPSPSKRQKGAAKKARAAMKQTKSLIEQGKQLQTTLISLLKHLESVWTFVTRYVVMECTSRLCDAKTFILKGLEQPEDEIQFFESTQSVCGALAWLSAALKATRQAQEASSSHQLMQHVLEHMFGTSVLLHSAPESVHKLLDQSQQQQDTGEHMTCEAASFQALHSFYANSTTIASNSSATAWQGPSVAVRQRSHGAAVSSDGGAEGNSWFEVTAALKALEKQLCDQALKENQGSRCQKLAQLGTFLLSSSTSFQNPPAASRASKPSKLTDKHTAPQEFLCQLLKLIAQAQEYPQSTCSPDNAEHSTAKNGTLTQSQQQPEATRNTKREPANSSHAHGSAPTASGAATAAVSDTRDLGTKRKRVHVAKGWLGCPIGTLPTCIAGVGATPGLRTLRLPPPTPPPVYAVHAGNDAHAVNLPADVHGATQHMHHTHHPQQQSLQGGTSASDVHMGSQQQGRQNLSAMQNTRANATVSGTTVLQPHGPHANAHVTQGMGPHVDVTEHVTALSTAIAGSEVLAAWDDMMGVRNHQIVQHASQLVQAFVASDSRIYQAGGDSMRNSGVEFNPCDTLQRLLHGLKVPTENVPLPKFYHIKGVHQIASGHEVPEVEDMQMKDVAEDGTEGAQVVEVASDVQVGQPVKRRNASSSGWNAELKAQFIANGLWEPLMQRVSGQSRHIESVRVG